MSFEMTGKISDYHLQIYSHQVLSIYMDAVQKWLDFPGIP